MKYLNDLKRIALEKYEDIKSGLTIAAIVIVIILVVVIADLILTVKLLGLH